MNTYGKNKVFERVRYTKCKADYKIEQKTIPK